MDTLTTTAVIVALAAALVGLAGGIVAVRRAFAPRAAEPGPPAQPPDSFAEARKMVAVGLVRFEIASGDAAWSDEMYRIAGLAPGAKAPGFWTFPDLVHADDREQVRRRLHDTAAGTAAFDWEFRLVRPDGAARIVHGVARREADARGNVVFVHAVFTDVTAHKSEPDVSARQVLEAAAALDDTRKALTDAQTAMARAESANRSKSESIAVLSHELRTPLNSILGFAGIIEAQMFGPAGSERYVDYARDIRKSGEHVLGLINDILDLSKIESGRMGLHEEPIDLLVVMRDAAGLFLEQASDLGITMKTAMPKDLPLLNADARLVKQMLINLISNALQYTRKGGWIELTADRNDVGGITLAVADTGVGIAPEYVSRIMNPFGSTGKPTNPFSRGTGLGLPLVKSMIELHGGTFHMKSAPDTGTVVSLRFPAGRVRANSGPAAPRKPGIALVPGAPKAAAGGGA